MMSSKGKNLQFDVKKRATKNTPLHERLLQAIARESRVVVSDVAYKVVGIKQIRGSQSDEFLLKKVS